jgi:hypothetical protein
MASRFRILLISAALAAPATGLAAELFNVSGTVTDTGLPGAPTQSFRLEFAKAGDILSFTETTEFQSIVPFYRDDVSAVTGTVNFRGVPVNLSFAQGSSTVNMTVPLLGEVRSFTGVDRDDALEQLVDYFLANESGFQTRFLQALVRSSPNDPVAGNPNSLQSQMIASDFALGGFDLQGVTPADNGDNDNKFFYGISAGTFRSQSVDGKTISVPLSYTARFDRDPRYQLSFALPLHYMDQSGAKTGTVNFSTGFQFPLTSAESKNQWYLTPRASVGATGSEDVGSAALMWAGSLTSRYVHRLSERWTVTVANMVAYSETVKLEFEDIATDYQLENTILKNGLQFERKLDFALFGRRQTSVQASYAHTAFSGSELYMNEYHEFGLSMGAMNGGANSSFLRIGLNGQFGKDFRKLTLGFGYTF